MRVSDALVRRLWQAGLSDEQPDVWHLDLSFDDFIPEVFDRGKVRWMPKPACDWSIW